MNATADTIRNYQLEFLACAEYLASLAGAAAAISDLVMTSDCQRAGRAVVDAYEALAIVWLSEAGTMRTWPACARPVSTPSTLDEPVD